MRPRRQALRTLASALALGTLLPLAVAAAPPSGLRYDPTAVAAGRRSLVSAPFKFELTARLASGRELELASDFRSDFAGLLLLGPGEVEHHPPGDAGCRLLPAEDGRVRVECAVEVVRVAPWGAGGADGRVAWLAHLSEEGAGAGTIRAGWRDGGLVFPASLEIGIDWVLVVRDAGAAEPVRLHTAGPALYEARLEGWPPYRADWPRPLVLELTNGPLAYFEEGRLHDPEASPYLVVEDQRISLGTQPTEFFETRPQWTSATWVGTDEGARQETDDVRGLRLRWRASASTSAPPVSSVSIYRNDTPGDFRGWKLVAQVPGDVSSWIDEGIEPGDSVHYSLSRVDDELPFGHRFEGAYSSVLRVEPGRIDVPEDSGSKPLSNPVRPVKPGGDP